MPPLKDLTGQKFGRWTVIARAENGDRHTAWVCQCECGTNKVVEGMSLKNGDSKSCGCYHAEMMSEKFTTHGKSHRIRLYKTWANMKLRCFNPNTKCYEHYGGRGITVCDEWLKFEPFYEWAMANGYTDDLTIDRIDANGNYEPSNCRWATMTEQARNKRQNTHFTYAGETHTISEWAQITGLSRTTIRSRIKRGWTIEQALRTR